MKHALRKYLAPCGSALFMVVSTMAALVVLVTAMYMAVISTGRVQLATFSQEQAYVSSTSIADIICSYIADGSNSGNAFVKKVVALKNVGDSISTNGNGFASLSGTGTNEDTELGGYDVAVTKMNDEVISGTTWHVYDVAVTVSNNGVLETTHTFMRSKDGKPGGPGFTRFFTATGYVPNDVFVSGVVLNSEAFYDAEYVVFGDIASGYPNDFKARTVTINAGLTCAGTAVFNKDNNGFNVNITEPTDWHFGNDLILKPGASDGDNFQFSLGGEGPVTTSEKRGRIIVGGNMDIGCMSNFGGTNNPTDVYVLGDLNITKPVTIGGNIYVGGNINISNNVTIYGGGKIYNTGKSVNVASGITKPEMGKWDASAEGAPSFMLSPDKVKELLNTAIGSSAYPKWPLSEDKPAVRNIIFNSNWAAIDASTIKAVDNDGDERLLSSYYKELSGHSEVPANKKVEYIDSDCTIGDIIDLSPWPTAHAIIIDTGEAGNTRTITLSPNVAFNGSDTLNGFTWASAYAADGYIYPNDESRLANSQPGQAMSIITVGDGNLVIDVPEGVTFQSARYEFMGHYAWFKYMGGMYNNNTYQCNISDSNAAMAKAAIHNGDGCTECTYTQAKNDDGEEGYTCTTHGGFIAGAKPETCGCTGRIEKSMFTGEKYMYNGVPQEPNVNFFLVSNDESADIQIGCIKYAEPDPDIKTIRTELYGYVYAPYMTYMDMSSAIAHGLKCCGGLIVSDYVMSGFYEYVFALPDVELSDMVGDEYLDPAANRSWRIYGT